MKDTDFLIVGQGLAGSLLAWELDRRGMRLIIVDDGSENSSKMAAGLINPITGRRFAKTPGIEHLLPTAKACYAALGRLFGQTFYHEKPMWRIFASLEQREQFKKRALQAEYRSYLRALSDRPITRIVAPYGFIEQRQTGYLAMRPLLDCLKNYFISRQAYINAPFDYNQLQLQAQPIWQAIRAKTIIFCEGYRAHFNPWFGKLPWQAIKGEILTLSYQSPLPDKILNNGHWLLPLNAQELRIGASFERDSMNPACTDKAREDLLAALYRLTPALHFRLNAHHAGIRPATSDRMPLLGRHPEHPYLAVFNGFGAKGSLLIPWHAQHFADVLLQRAALAGACSLQRHGPVRAG
jgi:glycine/D-amino acid oxidase-like deaminating enzyme